MSYPHVNSRLSTMLALSMSLFASATLAEDEARLELKAYVDGPGWSAISNGSYAEAATEIRNKLRAPDLMESLVAYNNLCVATTMLRELEEAEQACNTAVSRAKTYERQYVRHDRTASSTALNNRGVLNTIMGDADAAIADLRRSSAVGEDASFASERNLAYIAGLSELTLADSD